MLYDYNNKDYMVKNFPLTDFFNSIYEKILIKNNIIKENI